jgi:hypothetical protein
VAGFPPAALQAFIGGKSVDHRLVRWLSGLSNNGRTSRWRQYVRLDVIERDRRLCRRLEQGLIFKGPARSEPEALAAAGEEGPGFGTRWLLDRCNVELALA